jgi:type IV secretory pathway VirB9-like protein
MDVLNSLFTKAGDLELLQLQPLTRVNPGQRISLYANDVVLFIRPQEVEMNLTMSILDSLVRHQSYKQIYRKVVLYLFDVRRHNWRW